MGSFQGFWGHWLAVVLRPVRGLEAVGAAARPLRLGMAALALVLGTYTLILLMFLLRDFPAAAESILPLTVEEQYAYQIWYQGPLFVAMTVALAGLLRLLTRRRTQPTSPAGLFAQVSFATTIPFALTTMLVELVIALLVLPGWITPDATLDWLTGSGAWFATIYQLAGILWVVALLTVTARLATGARWHASLGIGLGLSVLYGLPIGLFIR
jgi:hypothetical protein